MQFSNKLLSARAAIYCYRPAPYRFSLFSLMLLVTLASVLMGVVTMVPPLEVLMIALSVLAVARTDSVVRRRLFQDRNTDVSEKISLFVLSLAGVAVVFVTALVTFTFAGCVGILALAAFSSISPSGAGVSLCAFLVFLVACFLASFVTFQIWKATGPDLT